MQLDSLQLQSVLPVVHPQRRRLRRGVFVTGIYEEAIAIVRVRNWDELTAAAYEPDGWRALAQAPRRGSSVIAPLASIRKFELTPLRRRSRIRKIRVTIETDKGVERIKTWWPAYDPIYAVLEGVLGDRLVIRKASLDWRLVFTLLFTVWAFVLIEVLAALSKPEVMGGIAAGFVVAAFWYTTLRLTGDGKIGAVAPRRRRKQRRGEPLRSRWAWPLRLFGLLVMAAVFILNTRALAEIQSDRETMFLLPIAAAIAYAFTLFGMWIIHIGYQLGLKGLSKSRAAQTAPIVYLRAFDDDAKHTLNRQGFTSMVMGVEPPPMFADMRPPWRYFGNGHPLRIMRLVAARGGDTSEEQLGRFMRRWGPFVAIGKPGELVATPGAQRMYVDDGKWKGEVSQLLDRANGVVLQPGASAGIWWEIGEVFRTTPPDRVLLVLSALGGPAGYRAFRARFGVETGLLLPEHAGEAPFIRFDADGTAHLLPAVHRTPFVWCFRSTTINLRRTLAPFSANLNTAIPSSLTPSRDAGHARAPRRPDSPLPPPRVRRTPFSCAAASLMWYILLVGGWTLAGAAVRDPGKIYAAVREAVREGTQGVAAWIVSKESKPEDRRADNNENGNSIPGVAPSAPSEPPSPERTSDIAAAPAPETHTPAPPPTASFHSPELGCILNLPASWRAAPTIPGWDTTFTGPDRLTLSLAARLGVPDPSRTIPVAGAERWAARLMGNAGYTNTRVADSGVETSAAGQYVWARIDADGAGGVYTCHAGLLPFAAGHLEFMFTSLNPGWENARADAADLALRGLALDPLAAPVSAPPLSYSASSLGCSFNLGSGWTQIDTVESWSATFTGPHGVNLGILEEPLDNDPARTIDVATVEGIASRQMTAAEHAQVRIVGSGVSTSGGSQYAWARADGTIDGKVWTYYLCIVPLNTGNLHLLFWGTAPGWHTDQFLTVKAAMEDGTDTASVPVK